MYTRFKKLGTLLTYTHGDIVATCSLPTVAVNKYLIHVVQKFG